MHVWGHTPPDNGARLFLSLRSPRTLRNPKNLCDFCVLCDVKYLCLVIGEKCPVVNFREKPLKLRATALPNALRRFERSAQADLCYKRSVGTPGCLSLLTFGRNGRGNVDAKGQLICVIASMVLTSADVGALLRSESPARRTTDGDSSQRLLRSGRLHRAGRSIPGRCGQGRQRLGTDVGFTR